MNSFQNNIRIGNRLSAAAAFVQDGGICADIGTDHAILPIYLVYNNIVKSAVATDINEGPLRNAEQNIKKYLLGDRIKTFLTNGLEGIERFHPTDIVICGMGGEMISSILSKSEYVKNESINIVLQPMTMIKELRTFLSESFGIVDETVVSESGKIYQIIRARYDGKKHFLSDIEKEVGPVNIEKKEKQLKILVNSLNEKKKKAREGLVKGGYSTELLDKEIKDLESLYYEVKI